MEKMRCIALVLSFALLLCACAGQTDESVFPAENSVLATEATAAPSSEPPAETTIPETTAAESAPTVPLRSELYLPGYTADQITEYFEEVVLNMEYSDGTGDICRLQKWLTPIYYQVHGEATEEDLEVLSELCRQLNTNPGFPGIYPATEIPQQNVSISFLAPDAFRDSFSDVVNGEEANGAVQFWYYTLTNELYTARIGCRTDLDQDTRSSVLQEEIINSLGITDTVLRPDSITYQYSDDNAALSDVDLLILKLLYDPAFQCGFDAQTCSALIQELYY